LPRSCHGSHREGAKENRLVPDVQFFWKSNALSTDGNGSTEGKGQTDVRCASGTMLLLLLFDCCRRAQHNKRRVGFRDGRKGGMLDILINQRARPASASATLQAKPELLDNITSLTATSHSALNCSSVLRPTRFAACSCATGANHTEGEEGRDS
jgi:hypothetical protein